VMTSVNPEVGNARILDRPRTCKGSIYPRRGNPR